MKKFSILVIALAFCTWMAVAQTSSQTQGASTSGANASAGQSGVNAGASNDTSASHSTTTGKGATTGSASGQSSNAANASANQSGANANLASGSTINAKLDRALDSKKAKPGDKVEAKTTSDTKSEGRTVIPRGSKLIGHVTQASARSKGDAQSSLGMVFDQVVLKNGQSVPLAATIQAVAAAQSAINANENDTMASGDMGGMGSANAGGPGMAGTGAGASGNGGIGSAVGGAGNAVGNTAGGATRSVGNTVGGATNTAGNTVGGTTRTVGGAANSTLTASGELTSSAQGVVGIPGMTLNQAANASQGTNLTSTGKNVHLDSGTQLLLAVSGATASNQ
jgi:hypothetical protein